VPSPGGRHANLTALLSVAQSGWCSEPMYFGVCARLWRAGLRRAEQLTDQAVREASLLLAEAWKATGRLHQVGKIFPAFVVSVALHAALFLVDDWWSKQAAPGQLWVDVAELISTYHTHARSMHAADVTRLRIGALDDALRHRVRAHYPTALQVVLAERITATDQGAANFHDALSYAFLSAFQELVEELDALNADFVPIQGTLISLLRYGSFPEGRLSRGKRDVVDNDAEVMVILGKETDLGEALKQLSLALERRGWPPCYIPHVRKGICFSLRHAVPCKIELYFVARDEDSGLIFAERSCSLASGLCEYHPVFPFQQWSGQMPSDVIYPMTRCRVGSGGWHRVLCPHRPLEFLRGWNHGEYRDQSLVVDSPNADRGLCAGLHACPRATLHVRDRCWTLSAASEPCAATCGALGLSFAYSRAEEAEPMVPKLLGAQPRRAQQAWMPLECYVAEEDRFHIAIPPSEASPGVFSQWTLGGDPVVWGKWAFPGCRLSCPCALPDDEAARPAVAGQDSGGGACLALPVLSKDRDRSDERNIRLQREGMVREDLRLLAGYARGLHKQGFASFHAHLREAACVRRIAHILAGDPLAGLSRMD